MTRLLKTYSKQYGLNALNEFTLSYFNSACSSGYRYDYEYSKKSLVYFFEELVYAITEYNYFLWSDRCAYSQQLATRRKRCNARRISLWAKKMRDIS